MVARTSALVDFPTIICEVLEAAICEVGVPTVAQPVNNAMKNINPIAIIFLCMLHLLARSTVHHKAHTPPPGPPGQI